MVVAGWSVRDVLVLAVTWPAWPLVIAWRVVAELVVQMQQTTEPAAHVPAVVTSTSPIPAARPPVVRFDDEAGALSPAAVLVAGVSPATRRTYVSHLRTLARTLTGRETSPELVPWHELDWTHVRALRGRLAETYRPATVRSIMDTFSAIVGVAARMGTIDRARLDELRRAARGR